MPVARLIARLLPRILWRTAIAAILLFLLAPIIVIVIGSFNDVAYVVFPPTGFSLRWYGAYFTSREFLQSTLLSAQLATIVTVISTLIGIMAALALSRVSRRLAAFLRAVLVAPLIVPGIIVGIAMLFYFFEIGMGNTFASLVLAHVVLTIPFVVLIVLAALQSLDRSLEEAAIGLGAGRFRATLSITLPLIKGNVFAAAVFAFIISFDELVVTLFLASPRQTTLPVRIYRYIEFTSDPSIAAISTLLIVVTTVAVLLVEKHLGFTRKIGR
jgi:putative spermidine/putrescine transport system permease protein